MAIISSCSNTRNNPDVSDENSLIDHKVDSLLALMTLEEKIGQMVQYNGSWDLTGPPSNMGDKEKAERVKKGLVGSMLNVTSVKATREAQKMAIDSSRLKIPLIFGYDVIHGYKTIFPIPLGETASWDLELMQKSAQIAAAEASASGIQWTFAPMMDISRDARWGRIMEGAGEDPYLNAKVAVARIKGFQGDDLTAKNTIAACAKHFAGYGMAEAGRDYNTANLGVHELHNTVLYPFKAAADAGVATFMNSFNEIDGIPATADEDIQRNILKDEWGWKGFIVSDWGSIAELVAHGVAKDKYEASNLAIHAGSDMDMEGNAYEANLEKLVNDGKVDVSLIDNAVRRILKVKFELGLFDDPFKYCDEEREKEVVYSTPNQEFSREVAKRSIVLLKNEGQLLPLKKDIKTLAVIGPLADDKDTPIGNWRAKGQKNSAVSLLEGVKAMVSPGTNVIYEKGCDLTIDYLKKGQNSFLLPLKINEEDVSKIPAAVAAARKADAVLLAIGENAYQTGEGRSQTHIGFAGVQLQLLNEILKVNKNIVIVLMNGRPMDITWAAEHTPTILECWHLGSQAGNAIADVVFGDYNPSGKLPVTFPYSVGQEPLYYNQKNTGRPFNVQHVTYSGYTDSPKTGLYPFGYGLSYTTFAYQNLTLDKTEIGKEGSVQVSVDVTNTGNLEGEEVVQLYIRDLVGSITRPVRELKAFEKVALKAGETKTVNFTLGKEQLQFYTLNGKWEVEPGDFDVFVGGDSGASLKATFTVVD
ncbi:MAG: beta-glucosidase BglX [Cyclobacteriaceae bacterium]|nr:beta-glucosidase BglX [Cyclobacteriaceae bacterium]